MAKQQSTIFYDSQCGMCRTGISRLQRFLLRYGFTVEPLKADADTEDGSPPRDIQLVLPSGDTRFGPDVYRAVMQSVWWLKPVYWLSLLPLGRQLFNATYRLVANHRHSISKRCNL